MEVILDRRLNQDDNLGLGQAIVDNVQTRSLLRLILEPTAFSVCLQVKFKHFQVIKP